eukprot:scaffold12093_cov137-Isochrysis_galbana.AAC.13
MRQQRWSPHAHPPAWSQCGVPELKFHAERASSDEQTIAIGRGPPEASREARDERRETEMVIGRERGRERGAFAHSARLAAT